MVEITSIIPAGRYSTQDVMAIMADFARNGHTDPKIQNIVFRMTRDLVDDTSRMLAIRNWILANLTYSKDPPEAKRLFNLSGEHFEHGELEMVKTPSATLETRRYDCDCVATLIAAMLLALGIQARFLAVKFHNNANDDEFSHVFTQGYDSRTGTWITIDPVSYPHEKQMLLDSRSAKAFPVG